MWRIVVMGVSGCGKSSVGAALAAALGVPYRDGDDLHPPGNVAKMRAGIALDDADRWPWLDRAGAVLADAAPVVLGCSALKRAYRDRLRAPVAAADGGRVIFVHLTGQRATIAARMAARQGHYMPATLLDSQFAALDPPEPDEAALSVPIDGPDGPDALAARILAALRARDG